MLADLLFYGQFTSSNQGATSLTVTIDIYQITRSSGASSQVVTGGSCTPLALGVYYYRYAGADPSLYDYIGVLKTTGTADLKQVPALWSDYSPALSKDSNGRVDVAKVAGTPQTGGDLAATQALVKAKTDLIPAAGPASAADYTAARAGKLDNLDAAVTSRSTLTAQQVWDVLTTGILGAGSIGEWILSKLNATVGSRAIPGDAMTLTAGERTAVANEVEAQIINDTDSEKVLQAIVDKIAAANPSLEDLTLGAIAAAVRDEVERVGSPLLLTQADVATLLTRITGPVLLAAGYTAPPTTGQIVTAINADATQTTARSNAATAATEATGANAKAADLQSRLPDALDGGRIKAKLATDPASAADVVTALNADATQTTARTNAATAATQATQANAKAGAIQTILAGITSLANWLRASMRKDAPDATAAAEIGGTFNPPTHSQEAIRDRGDAAWTTGAGGGEGGGYTPEEIRNTVWGNTSGVRNLTAPGGTTEDPPSGTDIVIRQGDLWTHSITGLGPIPADAKVYFTIRRLSTEGSDDSDALAHIERTAGLLVLNGASATATPGRGAVAVTDADAGNLMITLQPAATKALPVANRPSSVIAYGVKVVRDAEVDANTLLVGTARIAPAVTRATS